MVRINRFLYVSFDVCIVTVVPDGTAINIQATPISPYTIVYTWDNDLPTINGYLTAYNLNYSGIGQPDALIRFPVSTLGPYSYNLTNLTANTVYLLSLAVVNEIGEGPISDAVTATTYPTGTLLS